MLPNSVLNNAKYHNRASMISKERKVGTKRILVSAWPEFTTWEINFNSTKEVMTAISLPGGKSSNYNHPHPQVIFSVCPFCSVWKIAMVGSVVLGNFFPHQYIWILLILISPSSSMFLVPQCWFVSIVLWHILHNDL